MHSPKKLLLTATPVLILALYGTLPLGAASARVKLNASTVPTSGDAGVSLASVTGSGFPSGAITPSKVIVTLKPAVSGPPTAIIKAVQVTVVSGSTETVAFRIPVQLVVAAATAYTVSIAGATSAGAAFHSVNTAALTVNGALVITTTSPLPTATVGANYAQTLAATGGTGSYTWSITGGALPAGLTLNAATGQITGQPTAAGAASFTATVKDTATAAVSVALALTINPALIINTSSPLPSGTVGSSYSTTLTATGGSGIYTWSITVGALPGGLTLNAATGLISGQPTAATVSSFTAQVTDTNSVTAAQAFSLTTVNPPPALQTVSPSSGYQGLSLQVSITGAYTHFAQGTTTATFGPGTSVGGGTDGAPGPVTVIGPASATAQVTIGPAAVTGPQAVTVTTGAEQVSLANGFAILTAIPYITLETTAPKPLATGFSGFNDANVIHAAEYNDPKFEAMVLPLKPGFIRYPGGSDSLAFDWQTAHENGSWLNDLTPFLSAGQVSGLTRASYLGQAKGGVCFTSTPPGTCYSNFAELVSYTGANALVCFNGYTDDNPNSAANMVAAAKAAGLNMIEWELGNEPYAAPLYFPTPAEYAYFEYTYGQNIVGANPAATVGLFYQGPFSSFSSDYQTWDSGMSTYTPQYWNAVSTHVYPINTTLTTSEEEQQLNSVLGYATGAYVVSYLDPLIGFTTPIFITELSADTIATADFETYLYYGIFLAEYISRMSTVPNVKGVAVQALYLGNLYQQGIIRAVDDFETYLIDQVKANPNYSTNTAANPNTQFEFYYSSGGVALQVANMAINSSNAVWPTTVNGNIPAVPTMPVQGYGGPPISAVFAQGYQAIDGSHYLLITNKSSQSFQFAIIVNGSQLEAAVTLTYVSNPSDTAANTATSQNNLQVMTAASANPITIGPYSVTAVHW
jgi:hypothetical protein